MVIHALETALEMDNNASPVSGQWVTRVSEASVKKAKFVLDNLLEQKFALMPPEIQVSNETSIVNAIPDTYIHVSG